jgi:hypothetical protein
VERRLVGRLLASVVSVLLVSWSVRLRVGRVRVGMERAGVWGRPGTLLGPEGTGAPRVGCVVFLLRAASSVEPSAVWVAGCRRQLVVSRSWWVGAGCGGGSRP